MIPAAFCCGVVISKELFQAYFEAEKDADHKRQKFWSQWLQILRDDGSLSS